METKIVYIFSLLLLAVSVVATTPAGAYEEPRSDADDKLSYYRLLFRRDSDCACNYVAAPVKLEPNSPNERRNANELTDLVFQESANRCDAKWGRSGSDKAYYCCIWSTINATSDYLKHGHTNSGTQGTGQPMENTSLTATGLWY